MNQEQRLHACRTIDILWAANKYEELMQLVLQNALLVEHGYWNTLFHNSSDLEMKMYAIRRDALIDMGIIDERELRGMVLDLLARRQ